MVLARPFALLLLISILIISCEKKQLTGARVTVDFPESDSLAVKIGIVQAINVVYND